MSLKGKYSPPYSVDLMGEVKLTFKRMLSQEWEELSEQIKNARIDAEAAKINTEMKDCSHADRAEARFRMRAFMEDEITMSRVIRESSTTAKGIRRLFAYSLVEKDQAEWLDVIAPADQNTIIEQIVYLPVVKPGPQKLPPSSEASDGGSAPSEMSPTGQDTPPTSNPSSVDMTPAS